MPGMGQDLDDGGKQKQASRMVCLIDSSEWNGNKGLKKGMCLPDGDPSVRMMMKKNKSKQVRW